MRHPKAIRFDAAEMRQAIEECRKADEREAFLREEHAYYSEPRTGSLEEQELEDERGAEFGDPRRCNRHGTIISSADGMFDGLCGACEYEMDTHE